MSELEFVFGKSKNKKTSQLSEPPKINGESASDILRLYDRYQALLKDNREIRESKELQERLSQEISLCLRQLQSYKDNPDQVEIRKLDDKLNHLSDRHRRLRESTEKIIIEHMSELFEKYPQLAQMIVSDDGISRDNLVSVLAHLIHVTDGRMTAKSAIRAGMAYSKTKYGLPEDFYDQSDSAIDKFMKGEGGVNM